jgi:hypothetical protein
MLEKTILFVNFTLSGITEGNKDGKYDYKKFSIVMLIFIQYSCLFNK